MRIDRRGCRFGLVLHSLCKGGDAVARYVIKFGGTSVAGPDRLYRAAEKLADVRREGHEVMGVLSARAGDTDALLARAREIDPRAEGRELDALLATGEQCSVSLCALALRRLGVPAVGLSGWQAGILTDSVYGNARVLGLAKTRILRELQKGKIVLVTGFQGTDRNENTTTLGRGGSDTTAVALAAFLKADQCMICTDVDGVYDKDPAEYPDAVKYDRLSYDRMLELCHGGARVLHDRSVELAKEYSVPLLVCSSFKNVPGTLIEP